MSPSRRSAEATAQLRTSLAEVALRIVDRHGPSALTMRSLAAEAGCSVALPYKVFVDRTDLVAAVVAAEFDRLRAAFDEVVAAAGSKTVGRNLARWASILLESPAIALADEAGSDDRFNTAIEAAAGETGVVSALEATVVDYLAAEKQLCRVAPTVDEHAFGFLIAGAIHNLLASGEAYPRPTKKQLDGMLRSVAAALAPPPEKESQ